MDLFDIVAARTGSSGGSSKDLEPTPNGTVDEWEYNKFYKNIEPELSTAREYVFGDGTRQEMGNLLEISIVVKCKITIHGTSGDYFQDVVYNFDGQEVRGWKIDPLYKTIVSERFVPIDQSQTVTEISETVTNDQYPTVLAVKNYVDTVIGGIENGSY